MFWNNFAQQAPQDDEQVSVAHEAGDILNGVMPYGVSLLLHVGLLLIIAFATISMAPELATDKEQVIIPITPLSYTPGAQVVVSSPSTGTGPVSPTGPARPLPIHDSPVSVNSLADMTGSGAAAGMGPGSGGSSGGGTGTSAVIFGGGDGAGAGGKGGEGDLFSGGERAGTGLTSTFFGTGGNAVRVVYLIDASGTLISTLPFVINELKRSINELSEKQEFAVIFFQGNDPKEVPPPGMKRVSNESKTKVFNWIDSGRVIPQGGNNAVKAIQSAMSYNPQLIYILSDDITGQGIYEVDQRTFVQDVVKANKSGTKINAIQFLRADPLVAYGKKPTLKEISDKTGGIYKYLDGKELGIE